MINVSTPLNKHAIRTELRVFLENWRNKWNQIGSLGCTMGPSGPVSKIAAQHMSAENLELEKPEQKALDDIIEYCATAIFIAYQFGNQEAVIEEIQTIFVSFDTRGSDYYLKHMQKRIFVKVLDKIKTQTTIETILSETRHHLGESITFGFY